MKKYISILISFLGIGVVFPQTVEIKINNLENGRAYISSICGENVTNIDSVNVVRKDLFQFSLDNPQYQTGLYRFTFDKNNQSRLGRAQTEWIDFINDDEDVSITTNSNNEIRLVVKRLLFAYK